MSKSIAAKIYNRMRKVVKWTIRAEEASTREEASRALRKVAKHSLKLAALQSKAYSKGAQQTTP